MLLEQITATLKSLFGMVKIFKFKRIQKWCICFLFVYFILYQTAEKKGKSNIKSTLFNTYTECVENQIKLLNCHVPTSRLGFF